MTDLTTILDVSTGGALSTSGRAPIICWQNHFADPTVSVFSGHPEVDGHPAINVADGKEYTTWQSVSDNVTWPSIEIGAPSEKQADYLAIHGHNLGEIGARVLVQVWQADAFITVSDTTPATSAPLLIRFPSASSLRWRILFATTESVRVAVLSLGSAMTMERGCWEGFTPPWMGRMTEVTTTRSESGVLLGRSLALRGVEFDMNFEFLTIAFVRNSWMPFVIAAESAPFFVQWNPTEYPDDVAFCWIADPSKDIQRPRMKGPGHMSASVKVKGRVDGVVS